MVGQKIKRFLSVAVWMLCCLTGFAQYSVNFVNSVVTVIDGNTHPTGTIYDDGGPNGKYRNNFAGMVRIEADMGDTIIVWGHVKTEGACDQLFVYEGNGREGLIGAFCKDTSFALQSTSGYASLWFNTDRSIVDSGFTIHYEIHFNSCSNNVMEFEAIDIASTSVRLQWVSPDTNGPFLLDIDGTDTLVTHCYCDVTGLQSDTNYTFTIVSLADTANVYCPRSCTIHTPCFVAGISGARPLIGSRDSIVLVADSADGYIWNTGDTTREILVKQPGEYYVVAVTAGGCSDTAYARIIHVGLVLDINVPPCLCPGDQADIHVGFDRDATIRIIPGSAVLSVANEIFLPDGIYCDPYGCSYRSEQTFSGFPPGARIENVNDIRYVMLNIEHSWLGDLYMNITCPNGQSSNILRYGGVGTSACNSSITDDCRGWDPGNNASLGSYLGSALDSGDTRYPCDSLATLNRPGQGWRYCWSNATDAGYQYAPGDGRLYRAWNMVHSSIDSSDVLRRRQFYHPDDSFSNLVGCPMNGTWYIEVIDGWSEDNGYIFGWELALDSNRLMRNSYNPTLDSCTLVGPWYQRLTDTTFVITAPHDLSHDTLVQYILHIYDSNRHVFDTFFYVQFRAAVIDTIFDTITENDIPYTYNDSIFTNDTNNCIFHLYRKGDCHCDSTVIYNLFIKRSSTFSADTDICSDMLPLSWHGYTFDSAGTLIDTIPNHWGLDSVITLTLRVHPTFLDTTFATICSYDRFQWDDTFYSTTGSYHLFTHPSQYECDSSRYLDLYVYPQRYVDTSVTACDTFYFMGRNYDQSITDTIPGFCIDSNGCSVSAILHLTIKRSSTADTVAVACDSFDWYGRRYYSSLIDSLVLAMPNHNDCDSMLRLHLRVNYSDTVDLFDAICQNDWLDGYSHIDSLYGAPVALFPFDTLLFYHTTTPDGCYRLEQIHLHVKANSDSVIFDTICQNDWLDSAYPAPAAFPFDTLLIYHTTSLNGCDSMVSLHLHVNANTDTVIFDTICQNDWLDSAYPAPAAFPFDTILLYHDTSSNGCDSLISLHLHVNANPELSIYDTIYLGDIFSFGDSSVFADSCIFADTVLRVPGLYHSTLESLTDCDTLATLYLYARHLIYDTIYDTICQGDSIFFAHRYRSHEGIYFDTIPASSFTSDTSFLLPPDTIHLLFLTLIPQLHLYFDIQPFCDSDNPHYAIQAHTSAQYLKWKAVPSDPLLRGHENDSSLFVAPTQPTSYYVSAYHGDTPLCPLSDSITLSPIPFVTADIVTTPDIITFDNRELIAFNRDDANVTHHAWTTSYDADPPIFDSIDTITLEVPITANDVRIMLFVNNQFCADSDTVYVKVFNTTIYFPNVFTPDREDNNRFFAQGVGIIQFEMWIYDRRGSLVFHSTSIDQKWDGTSGGRICPQAAYAYKCRYTTILTPRGWQTKLGTVTLLR